MDMLFGPAFPGLLIVVFFAGLLAGTGIAALLKRRT